MGCTACRMRRCFGCVDSGEARLNDQAIAAVVAYALLGVGYLTFAVSLQPGVRSVPLMLVTTLMRTFGVVWLLCFTWPALASYCALPLFWVD